MTVTYLRRRVDGELEEVQGSYEGSASSLFVFTFLNAYTRGREEEQKLGKAPIYDVLVCYHDFIWSQDPSKESALEELSAQLAEGTTVRGEPIRDSKSYAMTSIRNFFRDFEDVITGEVVCESYDECVHGESASTTDKLCDEGDFDDSPFSSLHLALAKGIGRFFLREEFALLRRRQPSGASWGQGGSLRGGLGLRSGVFGRNVGLRICGVLSEVKRRETYLMCLFVQMARLHARQKFGTPHTRNVTKNL